MLGRIYTSAAKATAINVNRVIRLSSEHDRWSYDQISKPSVPVSRGETGLIRKGEICAFEKYSMWTGPRNTKMRCSPKNPQY